MTTGKQKKEKRFGKFHRGLIRWRVPPPKEAKQQLEKEDLQ